MSFNKHKTQDLDKTDNVTFVQIFAALVICIVVGNMGFAEEVFKYNPKGKRDPFVPLTSETGSYASDAYEASAAEDIRLEGIVWDDIKGSIAIINGDIAKEGDAIGSMKVLKINKDHVVFDIGGEEVRIDLSNE